ncbi:mechanosensitive ion channel protein MscS [Salmonella enterica subsp. enterica serovar Saintpaul]|nr:mechanosensitive ion channel protein MscS [Salmonella enterica]KNN48974.1 mechanosensitive ion channel protein MscS [Salmonella enterica subsp. enterica serovar Saintpaul]PJH59329.1 mechanosensitive ion channel protein MscS [Salmonella enterica subsp. enterica serovar Typhimurium]TYM56404.1 mechanosensitive ion channel [Salmonella enterica subsp. enterica serovar Typhimurium]TYM66914.1 mechanosensitive ion channel [Salmonella enterica subsp. enterica serovar Typhimurium]
MEGFELFPKIKGAIKWMAEHSDSVIHFGWNVVAAIILLFIGKLIARLLSRGLEKLLLRRQVDATIVHFFSALVRYITIAFTAVAALGRVGIETSSIIAVIGAAGLAIGLALQGSLSNFAAGVLLVSLRPFRAGEIVQIGLVIGTVEKVHIFSTTLLTADSKEVVIPNGKIIADNIINYSRHPYRRIDLIIGVDYQSRIADVKNVIHRIIEQDHRIDKTRDITVRLGELAPSSLNFYVRVWVPNAQY